MGIPIASVMLTERMLEFGQSLENQYVHSKFEAEKLILSAVSDGRISGKIMRVGNLSPRASDGEFQINFRSNAFMGSLRAYVVLGCAPYASLDAPCEFSPIDEVCRAIVLLASAPRQMSVFIPCNNHRLPLGDVLNILSEEGHVVRPVEMREFMDCRARLWPVMKRSLLCSLLWHMTAMRRLALLSSDMTPLSQIRFSIGWDSDGITRLTNM